MSDSPNSSHYLPADEEIAEQLVAFLLRCSEAKSKHVNPRVMSEITAKRVLHGLKRSGFLLVKPSPAPEVAKPAPPGQLYLL